SHPHLIRLFETGRCELDGVQLLFVVMEYAEENLSQIIPQRPLTTEEAREMTGNALDALGYLHDKGLVHGSVRLSNVMAAGDQLKLASDRIRQADGSSEETATAADVWSFGAMLCQSLTQRMPVQKAGQEDPAVPPLAA